MGTFFAAFFGFFVFCFMALFFGVFGVIAFFVIAGLIALIAASSHAQALRVERLKTEASARAQAAAWAQYQSDLAAWRAENGITVASAPVPAATPEPENLKVQRADGRKPWYLR